VVVVDDGSTNPRAVAAVAAVHAARLVRHSASGGPGIARNTGLAHVDTEFIAFLDSDCVAAAGWIESLSAHFADPLVGAVAPRIVALASPSTAGRYATCRGGLDLGDREARVVPSTRVAYVPTAALLVRRAALTQVATAAVFDPGLRYGEDVDLIWRLYEAGWRIRYDPTVQVAHEEPQTWPALLSRRCRYGRSAAPLARRHPADVAPLVLMPWPALSIAAFVAGRPLLAAAGLAAAQVTMARRVRRAGLPADGVTRATAAATYQTWLGVGRYATQFAAPALAASLLVCGHRRRVWWRRTAVASLLLGGPLATWLTRRPSLDVVRFTIGHIADDIAYGAGVYAGCARERTLTPIRPRILWQPPRGIASTTGRTRPKGTS
jgi:mycofactocin system glycosyltransferase